MSSGPGRRRQERPFRLNAPFEPCGDQPRAIAEIVQGFEGGISSQTLLGVTGSGKTFTMASVVAQLQRPTLVVAPNKTLAAQLYGEFKGFFPENAVRYFVSYYDYYQPEAYVPSTDTFIEKDASINDEIDKMRHSATKALLERSDVLIVASVSCIYGLGSPDEYFKMHVFLEVGDSLDRDELLRRLVSIRYVRNDIDFHRGTFRVRGDVVEIFPAYEDALAIRVELLGDVIEGVSEFDPLRGRVVRRVSRIAIYPASHYVTTRDRLEVAVQSIRQELADRLAELRRGGRLLEAQRLEQRTDFDLEMLAEMGFCNGIENYSRHLDGRAPGEPPATLLDYFPKDFLLFIDESHVTVPQIGGMYRGDRVRKETLVEYGFRLPSALDNRPLAFPEFERRIERALFVSATPADYEIARGGGVVAEQIIRPTGLMDPQVEIRPAGAQVDDLLEQVRQRVAVGERVLATVLTKKMAEDLTDYLRDVGIRVRYIHADVETIERVEIIRALRRGEFDVLVGINLLREGLDIPEVSLVAILDADREGYLRSTRALIQTIGRAARNINGKAILYADRTTGSMATAIAETDRRRQLQAEWNVANGVTPRSIQKGEMTPLLEIFDSDWSTIGIAADRGEASDPTADIEELRAAMNEAADALDFERAAELRDRLRGLAGGKVSAVPAPARGRGSGRRRR